MMTKRDYDLIASVIAEEIRVLSSVETELLAMGDPAAAVYAATRLDAVKGLGIALELTLRLHDAEVGTGKFDIKRFHHAARLDE